MLLQSEWLDRFIPTCARVRSARRRTLAAGQLVYSTFPDGRCWVVVAGYVKLLDPRADGTRFIRLILSRGGLFGDRPYEGRAFREFVSPQHEQAVAHGPAVVLELDRQEFEAASQAQAELATLLLESVTTRAIPGAPAALAVHHTDPGPGGRHAPGPDLLRGPTLPTRPHDRRPPKPSGPGGTRRRGPPRGQRRTGPDAARGINRVHAMLLLRGRPRRPRSRRRWVVSIQATGGPTISVPVW